MYFPVRLHLKAVAEKAIDRLQSAVVLPKSVSDHLECAQGMILDVDFQPSCDLVSDFGCGKPQNIIRGLFYWYVNSYGVPGFMANSSEQGILEVFMAEKSLNKLAEHLQTKTRDDISHGALLLIIFGAVLYASHQNQKTLQTIIDTVLADVFDEIRDVATLLRARDEVWKEINSKNPRVAALKDAPGLLLTNLRRSSQGFGREDLLKFKCKPATDISMGQKRQNEENQRRLWHSMSYFIEPKQCFAENKRRRKNKSAQDAGPSRPVPRVSHQTQKAEEAYANRVIRRKFNEKQQRLQSKEEEEARLSPVVAGEKKIGTPGPSLPPHKVAKPLEKPAPPPLALPKARGAYPTTLTQEVQLEINVLLLAPPDNLRLKKFTIKAPPISDQDWSSISVNDPKKCEGLLAIGQYIIQASFANIVYGERYQLPLTDELVLGCLTSDETLQTVLIQAGVFHEHETVPAYFPARALKVTWVLFS
ncbi:hypothetical protein C8R44DRAFT_896334 [Mycena epipterygia]|nr:hypothetical protein C8R44DRAFT_896334 [Mycena epipterygia]